MSETNETKVADVVAVPRPRQATSEESETLGALAAALAKAQGAMKPAKKDALNPHFRSKYADLAAIWESAREPLAANGLAVMQRVTSTDTAVVITTHMVHASGEWVKDRCYWPVAQRTPQGIGSAITYGKRYALAALLGIAAEEDDDGNEASGRNEPPPRAAPRNTSGKVANGRAESKAVNLPPSVPATPDPDAERRRARADRIWKAAKAQGYDRERFADFVRGELGSAKQSVEWTDDDADKLEFALSQVTQAQA